MLGGKYANGSRSGVRRVFGSSRYRVSEGISHAQRVCWLWLPSRGMCRIVSAGVTAGRGCQCGIDTVPARCCTERASFSSPSGEAPLKLLCIAP
jgi:hypothetical protein